MARVILLALIAAGIVLRLLVVPLRGFPDDPIIFGGWAERLAKVGPGGFYEPGYFADYPPAFMYVLWLFGALFEGESLRLAIKAVSIPADIAIALLAAGVIWPIAGRGPAVVAAGIWSLQPAAILAGPYWGQVDAIGSVFLFASLAAAGSRRWAIAGALGALALLVKPQFGIGLFVIGVGAVIELVRIRRWAPGLQVIAAATATTYVLSVPFWGFDPVGIATGLVGLMRTAAETYPYTSLYAFNGWMILFQFRQPDEALVVWGATLLTIGLLGSTVPLWWRRDTAAFLACGALAAIAFYFLPTRAHERYLFPLFALALPFAATRARVVIPYAVLSICFAITIVYALSRMVTELRIPAFVETTLFTRRGEIAIALLMISAAVYLAFLFVSGEARLDRSRAWLASRPGWLRSRSRRAATR